MTRERRYEAGPWLANAAWARFGSEARVIEMLDGPVNGMRPASNPAANGGQRLANGKRRSKSVPHWRTSNQIQIFLEDTFFATGQHPLRHAQLSREYV